MFDQVLSQFLIFLAMGAGAVITATWLGITFWTWRDMGARSRDTLARIAATAMVAVLNVFGLVIYLMLRPRETIAEAYERSLEEEALLQSIEEKPVCPGCGRAAHERWQVCPHCYTRLKHPCANCGELLDITWAVCPFCATQQGKADSRGQRRRAMATKPQPTYEEAPDAQAVEGE
jgi:F0F1-type ATP synthase membrane subunit c/vacuolar-type H+-ATPase subunit K